MSVFSGCLRPTRFICDIRFEHWSSSWQLNKNSKCRKYSAVCFLSTNLHQCTLFHYIHIYRHSFLFNCFFFPGPNLNTPLLIPSWLVWFLTTTLPTSTQLLSTVPLLPISQVSLVSTFDCCIPFLIIFSHYPTWIIFSLPRFATDTCMPPLFLLLTPMSCVSSEFPTTFRLSPDPFTHWFGYTWPFSFDSNSDSD